jgi:hypothetical protein
MDLLLQNGWARDDGNRKISELNKILLPARASLVSPMFS